MSQSPPSTTIPQYSYNVLHGLRTSKCNQLQQIPYLVRWSIQGRAGILHAKIQRVLRVAMPQAGLSRPEAGDVYPAVIVVELSPVHRLIVNLNILHLTPIECPSLRHGHHREAAAAGSNVSLLQR